MQPTTLQQINQFSNDQFIHYFQNVFENSPWIVEQAAKQRPFNSIKEMLTDMNHILENASKEQKLALIRAHPELGYDNLTLTAESQHEQKQAQLHSLTNQQKQTLQELNKAYKQKFGFPFVICVRKYNSYEAIVTALKTRLSTSPDQEIKNSLAEIGEIAALRINYLLTKLSKKQEIGLSTHILDEVSGSPAANVKIVLFDHKNQIIFEGTTDNNGRCVVKGLKSTLSSGSYQFAFHIADYFKTKGYKLSDPPFLNIIYIDFGISDKTDSHHYHVPLLVSPYGYSTYRGS